MENKTKKLNDDLIKFWNQALKLPDDYQEEVGNYKDLAPSEKLYEAICSLRECHKLLDYGCGSAWASIIASKNGNKDILAVDLGNNIINTANFYIKQYDCDIKAECVDANWLNTIEDNIFDGIICSNVLDVIPTEISENIIEQFHRILKKDGLIVIGLNYYISKEYAKEKGLNLVDGKYVILENVLRLTSLSDEDWTSLFEPYFEIIKLDHFGWPGEQKETRRLFFLKRK